MNDQMIGVDTNIVVRYLTRDDEAQAKLVDRLVAKVNPGPLLYINPIVAVETVWVLTRKYKLGKAESQHACRLLLETRQFISLPKLIIGDHENWFSYPESDFSDVLICEINKNSGCNKTVTFDKMAAKNIPSMELLT